ncbi:hypothetical protein D9M68_834200 [compost metagenome]
MHDYGDMIRIVEGRCAALERGVIELPLRRGVLPDQLREVAAVFVIPRTTALRGEIKLVPPLELVLRRQRHPAGFLTADQVPAHGHQCLAAFRPECGDDDAGRQQASVRCQAIRRSGTPSAQ